MRSLFQRLQKGAVGLLVLSISAAARAQGSIDLDGGGDISTFEDGLGITISVLQGLFLLGGVLYLMRAGSSIYQSKPDGWEQLKNAGMGLAIVAAAVVIAQFIKNSFTA